MSRTADDKREAAPKRSIEAFLQPLLKLQHVRYTALGSFPSQGKTYSIPRFTVPSQSSSDPLRIGLFAAIHGDEPAGAAALSQLLLALDNQTDLTENFELEVYPICNPTGFEHDTRHSRSDRDLNREFWRNSPEPEVRILEEELLRGNFSGIIQLHADDTSNGIYGFVKGHTLTENLLRPALREAGKILPRNANAIIDGFAARDGIIYDAYEGVLAAPARIEPAPFEIILETPHAAPQALQVQALIVAVGTILTEYRRLISFAPNL